jgi:cell fate (sporulation/competence/biofilm development) regulator YlbF (YheA/YmcA/DUF963 family)
MTSSVRLELKNIVKECLIEILSEGISNSAKIVEAKKSMTSPAVTTKSSDRQLQEMQKMRQTIASKVQFGNGTQKSAPQNSINSLVRSVTNDNVMASLFADTAETTLQEQVENDRRLLRGHSVEDDKEVDLPVGGSGFSEEMAKHWSTLAFNEVKSKK